MDPKSHHDIQASQLALHHPELFTDPTLVPVPFDCSRDDLTPDYDSQSCEADSVPSRKTFHERSARDCRGAQQRAISLCTGKALNPGKSQQDWLCS
jgi:hypothetical protein